ncbi:Mitochondrial substrate carrier family protein [Klebsormidium nitens]|uniref:Mitochondrial substrate carrier family protein n=1 Tax=Klebsormidium nitens TaxID=105231 RepID=A0A1Y1INI6_KLENI|nr:Mitochondrial substrate carrier family protein [Klebsormidium nitens]|eukprot:GAQ90346.1 Mitochondrial substrate carrier family protein [Klebsormidium nitens]
MRHFVGGGIAGAVGATLVCPIDIVKTRLQGQETKKGEKKQYANSADCFLQILTKEGPGAFFSGLLPQVIGVAPEKAIKLTVNDLLMGVLESYVPGMRPWILEPIAGSGGGMAQVLFTNPMEMVKIRQQMRRGGAPKSALAVVRELGVAGLYRGSAATLLRDIPYSAMFFGIYVYLKQAFPEQPFVAAGLAAVPAAFLCTPMDVVKTRIQMERSEGEEDLAYWETLAKIVKDEGPQALFAGGLERVLRTSPQFDSRTSRSTARALTTKTNNTVFGKVRGQARSWKV